MLTHPYSCVGNQTKKPVNRFCRQAFCDSCRIQTCNLLIRSQMLYSVELTNQSYFCFVTPAGFKPATF